MRAVTAALSILVFLTGGEGHGRLMNPPARNSMWRFGYLNPINYNDNEVFCGGVSTQFEKNGGRCGICGDSWEEPHPQPHETGGLYGNAIVSKTYVAGSWIDLEIELTANHKGWFQFKLCPVKDREEATQGCLDRNIIRTKDGAQEFPLEQSKQKVQLVLRGKLPEALTCNRCVLQWTWRSANSWGNCNNGTAGLGCGAQETFRNCADVRIVGSSRLLPDTDNPRAIYVPDKSGRGLQPLVVRSQVCVVTEAYRMYNRMSDWCQLNCLNYPQHCPPTICTCLDTCSARPGYNLTDFDCNKKCLRYPHVEQCPRGCDCRGNQEDEAEFVIIENSIESEETNRRKAYSSPLQNSIDTQGTTTKKVLTPARTDNYIQELSYAMQPLIRLIYQQNQNYVPRPQYMWV